jgi:LacI family transcriptional regulator/LacI family purine nucleotide synthesis repressor
MNKLRQKDIAKLANVSPSTVSLLLKDPHTTRVSAETRERIFRIIRENRYTGGARHVQGDIAVAIPKFSDKESEILDFFYTTLLLTAERTGQHFGYTVQLRSYGNYEELAPLYRDPAIAGIISINSSRLAEEFPSEKPVVAVNTVYTSSCDVVKSHWRGSARDQAALLVRHGHRRIAYFVAEFPPHPSEGMEDRHEGQAERFSGYCEGLYHHQLPTRPEYCDREILPEFSYELEEVARRGVEYFRDLPEPPTAIIAYNDLHAVYLIRAAQQFGLRIPEDLSIVGNDNMEMGRYSNPALTTAEQDRSALGRIAIERLVQRIEDRTSGAFQIISLPLKLIERQSVATLPPEA